MIRNPVKVGSITAAASGVLDLSINVGHKGTICGFFFQCFKSDGAESPIANVKTAIDKINLSVTHRTEGGSSILNDVTPTFLYFREQFFAATRGLTNATSVMHYDPSAALRGGEAAQNIRNIGTRDLIDMVLRVTFAGTITNVARIDVYCDIDYGLIADLGAHVRIAKVTTPVAIAGGDIEVINLPRVDSKFGYECLHIHSGALTDMTVTKLSLVLDGSKWEYRDVPKGIIDRQLILADRTPQTGFTTLDFAKEDNPAYVLSGGMSEIKLIPNLLAGGSAAAGNLAVWYEVIRKG